MGAGLQMLALHLSGLVLFDGLAVVVEGHLLFGGSRVLHKPKQLAIYPAVAGGVTVEFADVAVGIEQFVHEGCYQVGLVLGFIELTGEPMDKLSELSFLSLDDPAQKTNLTLRVTGGGFEELEFFLTEEVCKLLALAMDVEELFSEG